MLSVSVKPLLSQPSGNRLDGDREGGWADDGAVRGADGLRRITKIASLGVSNSQRIDNCPSDVGQTCPAAVRIIGLVTHMRLKDRFQSL